MDRYRELISTYVQGHILLSRFYRLKENEHARENDPDRILELLRQILDLKQRRLQLLRLENEQKERERRNLERAWELHRAGILRPKHF